MNLRLHFTSQFQILIVLFDIERPPTLHSLLFENIDHRYRSVVLEHFQRAQLGGFRPSGKPVQVQRDGAKEIVGGKVIGVPDLEFESGWDLAFGFVPGEEGFFAGDDDLLFGDHVVEGVDETPVEVALAGKGAIVDVRALAIFLAFQPAALEFF